MPSASQIAGSPPLTAATPASPKAPARLGKPGSSGEPTRPAAGPPGFELEASRSQPGADSTEPGEECSAAGSGRFGAS